MSPKTVKRAHLDSTESDNMTGMVGTGIRVSGLGIYKAVKLQLQSIRITTDFLKLEPGCTDIILGVQWLRALGKCEVDWDQQEFSFFTQEGKVALYGDPYLHNQLGQMDLIPKRQREQDCLIGELQMSNTEVFSYRRNSSTSTRSIGQV
ncbi:hypothetical protein Bca52824_011274 [Brassica carinata]|uniref:Ty3-gypsy retrotransposon protein n=1 Tax=Brassica carinata TaxID=52824 RepID=A0A8X7WEC9_BRACI|nr:hypothetical protein Bca52824_011274 [Brassica carinata]